MPQSPPIPPLLSVEGLRFLQRHEGFRNRLYNDSAGHATIGYGHLVHKGAVGTDPKSEAVFSSGISQIFGSHLLAADCATAEKAVRQGVKGVLLQHQWDALISFTFNVGASAFLASTLLRRINAGALPTQVKEAFMMWNKPSSIVGRRRDEADLFLSGKY